jgi:hypothetical protein
MTTRNRTGCGTSSTDRGGRRGCGPSRPSRCSDGSSGGAESLEALVDSYLANEALDAVEEARFFGDRRISFVGAVERAACSVIDEGLHPHQHRLGYARMRDCASVLRGHAATLAAAPDFAALHGALERILRPIGGYGALAIYDIAERIGWYRGLEPEHVYLHSGTREGALVLDPSFRGDTVGVSDLPPEIRRLTPAQAENFLCIYKAGLQELRRRGKL